MTKHKHNDESLGKAYKAYFAFNFKAKLGRIPQFDPTRWLRVVDALNGGGPKVAKAITKTAKTRRAWSPAQRAAFKYTIAKRNSK